MKTKNETNKNWLTDELNRVMARRGKYIKSRFYVVEVTPSRREYQGNGHGGLEPYWTKQKTEMVSEFFDTQKKAEDFLNEHEPDDGKTLETREDKLYRKTVETWY